MTLTDGKSPVDVTVTLTVKKYEPPAAAEQTVKTAKGTPVEITLSAESLLDGGLTLRAEGTAGLGYGGAGGRQGHLYAGRRVHRV